jgi:hypothetical protein
MLPTTSAAFASVAAAPARGAVAGAQSTPRARAALASVSAALAALPNASQALWGVRSAFHAAVNAVASAGVAGEVRALGGFRRRRPSGT